MITNQSEGAQHRQALNIGQSQLHQTHGHDDTVKNVPTHLKPRSQCIYGHNLVLVELELIVRERVTRSNLEVEVWVHCQNFKNHLTCEDTCEDLRAL